MFMQRMNIEKSYLYKAETPSFVKNIKRMCSIQTFYSNVAVMNVYYCNHMSTLIG